jgi:phenylalanine ammonia-lyase
VNTDYGGSADVRCGPEGMYTLQRAFLQHQHIGVLPIPSSDGSLDMDTAPPLKEEWVRATMLVRANSVARGHSAVRLSTIESLLRLLRNDIIPLIPTRASISASGDLSPLSYIAGVLEGNSDIFCWVGPKGSRRVVPAQEALSSINTSPVVFQPKEALGLVNGTALSCAVGSLALCRMHNLLALSQLLTAMNVEAMLGTAASFDPFLSKIRPHSGQAQVASTILSALKGSQLSSGLSGTHGHALFQDRYSLRTVPQWLGPFMEDMFLAHQQLDVELNSTTDNPLIDPDTGDIHHGGNFQAVSVTSAMEKCRLAAQAIGRMLFSQLTELLNHATNRGLPPNLCADDPSTSFTLKGVDIAMAAYQSELSFLANTVHNHVNQAEMGNQALNSLALISARYTDSTCDILTLMCASTLYAVCQALDLRAMSRLFEERWQVQLNESLDVTFKHLLVDVTDIEDAKQKVWQHMKNELGKTTALDTKERFETIMQSGKLPLLEALAKAKPKNEPTGREEVISGILSWPGANTQNAITLFNLVREVYFTAGDASVLLGEGSRRLYRFVRQGLGVPMSRGVADHSTSPSSTTVFTNESNSEGAKETNDNDEFWRKKTIGHWISVIHEAIKNDVIIDVVVDCLG